MTDISVADYAFGIRLETMSFLSSDFKIVPKRFLHIELSFFRNSLVRIFNQFINGN